MVSRALFLAALLCVALVVIGVAADDPSPTWLTYARQTGGDGSYVTAMTASVWVPDSPTKKNGGPAWWIGIEPTPADDLLQVRA